MEQTSAAFIHSGLPSLTETGFRPDEPADTDREAEEALCSVLFVLSTAFMKNWRKRSNKIN
jgi:hypothetical protein